MLMIEVSDSDRLLQMESGNGYSPRPCVTTGFPTTRGSAHPPR